MARIEQQEKFVNAIIKIARDAGKEILEIYESDDFDVEIKDDDSPLTRADKAAHDIIVGQLSEIAEIPIISEEDVERIENRVNLNEVFLVDPLDGTKEFIKRNGEFTVNIALIRDHEPVFGVVYAPVLDKAYVGIQEKGAFTIENGKRNDIQVRKRPDVPTAVVSKSHMNEETEEFLKQFDSYETVSVGSSLKLCLVAEGKADIYPRIAPTMEWDTAAGDAVVRAAGGTVTQFESNEPMVYNKENLLNPYFVAQN